MDDLIMAKALLKEKHLTLAAVKGDKVFTSEKSGIAPMMELIGAKADLSGFSVADKIVGKAAALLFSLKGIKRVHAEVISEAAVNYLTQSGIEFSFDKKVEKIINRTGSGICPMEKTVLYINDPSIAYEALADTIKYLKQSPNSSDAEKLTIARVSLRLDISADTLRYYERIGLIPKVQRSGGGIRLYSEEDLKWIEYIKCMRSAGVSVDTLSLYVKLVKEGESTVNQRKQLLIDQRAKIKQKTDELEAVLSRLDKKISGYEEKLMVFEEGLK